MNKIDLLRNWLTCNKLNAFIVPSSDAHQSEYVAPHWASRKWLTGFTGSAGTAVVTTTKAALWTDSRYFLQAAEQLQGFELQRSGLLETPTIEQWILENTSTGDRVGVDGRLFTKAQFDDLQKTLTDRTLVIVSDPFAAIWNDRPPLPTAAAFILADEYTGESRASKIARIRREDATMLISILDDIAWLLNIRGNDVECNPVVMSYVAVEPKRTILFVDTRKFSEEDKAMLRTDGVELREYEQWSTYLRELSGKVVANPSRLDVNSYALLKDVEHETTPLIASEKALKNSTELSGFRRAMVDDGVALCRFMMWLEQATGVTEYEAAERLSAERAKSSAYRGDSFGAIVAYGANGAQAHYSPPKKGSAVIGRDNFLLIDSGGQYLYGTTDITRTYHFGTPTEAQKRDYTNILLGVIDLSRAVFPAGTRGTQLDVLARQHMWADGTNFLHGTGHGVGHFLCVHEGPQSIRMNENPVTLKQGMVQSIEPAIYRTGQYGIRTENLVATVVATHDGYMRFETLTLSPIDTCAIDISMMQSYHVDWLNDYHRTVYETLSPQLTTAQQQWLLEKTRPIKSENY